MMRFEASRTALMLAAVLLLGSQAAFAQEANTVCDGLTIVSLEPSHASSKISGEFSTFSFDITATIENAGDESLPAAQPARVVTLASGEKSLATLEVGDLAAHEQATVTTKVKDWSPYTDYGFKVSISPSDDTCSLAVDGTELEQQLRGQ